MAPWFPCWNSRTMLWIQLDTVAVYTCPWAESLLLLSVFVSLSVLWFYFFPPQKIQTVTPNHGKNNNKPCNIFSLLTYRQKFVFKLTHLSGYPANMPFKETAQIPQIHKTYAYMYLPYCSVQAFEVCGKNPGARWWDGSFFPHCSRKSKCHWSISLKEKASTVAFYSVSEISPPQWDLFLENCCRCNEKKQKNRVV